MSSAHHGGGARFAVTLIACPDHEITCATVEVRTEERPRRGVPVTDSTDHIHVAVALEGAGWHPAAWREESARPDDLFGARYWVDLVATAERAALDAVTIEDSFGLRPTKAAVTWSLAPTWCRGASTPSCWPIASRRRRRTSGSCDGGGDAHRAVPHVEGDRDARPRERRPRGGAAPGVGPAARGGAVRASDVSEGSASDPTDPANGALVGDLFREAHDYAEVLRRLWDSWEDDAEIRGHRHRTVCRPRQAALHRLRGSVVLRTRAVHHPTVPAGPAGDRGARPPGRAVRVHRRVRRRRVHHAAGHSRRGRHRRRDRRRTPRGRPERSGADSRRPVRRARRHHRRGAGPSRSSRRPFRVPCPLRREIVVGTAADVADRIAE